MCNRISDIDLEDKEIEIGELQLEIEKLNDVIENYEKENQLLRTSSEVVFLKFVLHCLNIMFQCNYGLYIATVGYL